MLNKTLTSSAKLSLLALVLTSTTALAGGVAPAPQPPVVIPVADVTDWTGVYVGLGYSSVSNGTMEYNNIATQFEYLEGEMESFFIGYNYQFSNNFVVGGELNYSSGLEGVTGFPTEFLDDILSVRLRGGYAFGNLHAYGFAGYAVSEYSIPVLPAQWDVDGETYGLGVEYMINDRFIVGLEYARWNLSGDTGLAVGQTQTSEIDAITLRAAFHF